MERPSKDEHYLNIALEVSKRSTCLRRHFGAIIVKDDSQVSSGYNGSARGAPNCLEFGCLKDKHKIAPGLAYDFCRAGPLHAEVNAIINAARRGIEILHGTMYIAGEYADGRGLSDAKPCIICKKQIINSGISNVIIRRKNGGIERFAVEEWVKDAYNIEDKDIVNFYI